MSGRVAVLRGDAARLPLPDESVDAVVCDPPYGLAELSTALVLKAIAAWMAGDRLHVPDGRGFMGREWDKFVPPPGAWDECLRVLKPGGHLLAFAGTRTVDLMTLSIRIAGFEIRDSIDWIYGSGFPKSLDVSKAIDKAAGAEREVVGEGDRFGRGSMRNRSRVEMDYRPTEINPDGGTALITAPATEDAARWDGWGTALKPAHEPIVAARKPIAGTVAQNVLQYGTGALNIAGCRVEANGRPLRESSQAGPSVATCGDGLNGSRAIGTTDDGRWPPNILLGEEAAAELDRQSGVSTSIQGARRGGGRTAESDYRMRDQDRDGGYGDTGGASRYFPIFRYEPKADSAERPRLPDGTAWPTVKPVALMQWLVRLVTPPGGVVLDCFSGTGTTGEACAVEGFDCILLDRDPQAIALTRVRLAKAIQPGLFRLEDSAPAAPLVAASRPKPAIEPPPSLFDELEDAS